MGATESLFFDEESISNSEEDEPKQVSLRSRPLPQPPLLTLEGLVLGMAQSGKQTLLQRLEGKDPFNDNVRQVSRKHQTYVPYKPPARSFDRIQIHATLAREIQTDAIPKAPDFIVLMIHPQSSGKRLKAYIEHNLRLLLRILGYSPKQDPPVNAKPLCLCLLVNFRDLAQHHDSELQANLQKLIMEVLTEFPLEPTRVTLQCTNISLRNCFGLAVLHHFIYQAYLQRKAYEAELLLLQVQCLQHETRQPPLQSYEEFTALLRGERPEQRVEEKRKKRKKEKKKKKNRRHSADSIAEGNTRVNTVVEAPPSPPAKQPPSPKDALEAFLASDEEEEQPTSNSSKLSSGRMGAVDDDDDEFFYDDLGQRTKATGVSGSQLSPTAPLANSTSSYSSATENEQTFPNDEEESESIQQTRGELIETQRNESCASYTSDSSFKEDNDSRKISPSRRGSFTSSTEAGASEFGMDTRGEPDISLKAAEDSLIQKPYNVHTSDKDDNMNISDGSACDSVGSRESSSAMTEPEERISHETKIKAEDSTHRTSSQQDTEILVQFIGSQSTERVVEDEASVTSAKYLTSQEKGSKPPAEIEHRVQSDDESESEFFIEGDNSVESASSSDVKTPKDTSSTNLAKKEDEDASESDTEPLKFTVSTKLSHTQDEDESEGEFFIDNDAMVESSALSDEEATGEIHSDPQLDKTSESTQLTVEKGQERKQPRGMGLSAAALAAIAVAEQEAHAMLASFPRDHPAPKNHAKKEEIGDRI